MIYDIYEFLAIHYCDLISLFFWKYLLFLLCAVDAEDFFTVPHIIHLNFPAARWRGGYHDYLARVHPTLHLLTLLAGLCCLFWAVFRAKLLPVFPPLWGAGD